VPPSPVPASFFIEPEEQARALKQPNRILDRHFIVTSPC